MYPILLNLENKNILIVGGGRIGLRKAKALLEQKAKVTVWSISFLDEFATLPVQCIQKSYEPTQGEFDFIFACTDDQKLNQKIFENEKCFVNNVSDKTKSDFYNMGCISYQDFWISVSSEGRSPSKVKKLLDYLKEKLEEYENET